MKYAVCTLAANKEYIQGALNLYYSYNNLGLPYDFIIMLPTYLKDSSLPIKNNLKYYCYEQEHFFTTVEIERHKTTFNKFQAFNLIEYDKVLFLDADLILGNNNLDVFNRLFAQEVKTFRCPLIIAKTPQEIIEIKKNRDSFKFCWHETSQQYIRTYGQQILFKPNRDYFNSLLQYLPLVRDDEMLMASEISSIKDFVMTRTLSMCHDQGYPKYWQKYNCFNWEQFIINFQTTTPHISQSQLQFALTKVSQKQKYAYCTLVTNKKYIQGALNLYYSLQAVHANYDFIVLISEKLKSEPVLTDLNTKIIPNIKFTNGSYKDSICKLCCYSLTEYDKVMFIDSDALIYKNPDYLFELSTKDFIGTKNYYNNLDRSQDINWFVWATIFIIKPSLDTIRKVFNSQILSSYTNEEDVLMKILDFNEVYLTEELKVPLIHFCGQPKYWESFKEDFKWQEFINYIIKTVTNYRTQYNEKAPLIDMLRLFYDNYLCYKNGDPDIK